MSEFEREPQVIKVNDRRRFDPEGNAVGVPSDEAPAVSEPVAETPENVAPAEDPRVASLQSEVDRLQGELATSRARVDELARAYQALDRDREEFKQRLTRERERMISVEKGNVASALLEAIDELDLALRNADDSPLATGVRLTRDNLLRKAESTGIERIQIKGQPFDPNLAEAADMEITAEEADDQKIVDELRAGYTLGGRVIRPARVKVAKYVRPADA
jgi:molecular chaperone GrpE